MPNFVDVGLATRVDASAPDLDNPPKNTDDAYPAIIEDQRHAYRIDLTLPATRALEDIAEWQRAFLAGEAPPHPVPRPPIALEVVRDDREVIPHINASRWIGICWECAAANAVWDNNPTMICLGCGRSYKVAWQLPALRAEVIRVLAGRNVENRNWDAHKDETLEELKIQNVLMQGVAPERRNGLLVAAGVTMPDDITSPQEYADRLYAQRVKRQKAAAR